MSTPKGLVSLWFTLFKKHLGKPGCFLQIMKYVYCQSSARMLTQAIVPEGLRLR